ncbi:hypothetical protein B0H14DRAFT_2595717 [Mycena olivaceomarginata]|nr:hypothetical protein B0H14DRAFT_2595717 [Mycena olivaceomarginata]
MKTLLIFCDGTGMDGSLAANGKGVLDQENFATVAELDGGNNTQYAPKVLRLGKFLHSIKSVDLFIVNKQVVFYQSGVGSEANLAGDPVTGTMAICIGFGNHCGKIRDAYVFVTQNFEDGGSNLSLWVRMPSLNHQS